MNLRWPIFYFGLKSFPRDVSIFVSIHFMLYVLSLIIPSVTVVISVCGAAEYPTAAGADVVWRAAGVSSPFSGRQVRWDGKNRPALPFPLLPLHRRAWHSLRPINTKALRQVLDSRLFLSLLSTYANLMITIIERVFTPRLVFKHVYNFWNDSEKN